MEINLIEQVVFKTEEIDALRGAKSIANKIYESIKFDKELAMFAGQASAALVNLIEALENRGSFI